ncbi:MAG: tetratricopeptide repeat protein [Pseudomonadota bacterium]
MVSIRCVLAALYVALISTHQLAAQERIRILGVEADAVKSWNTFVERLQQVHEHYLRTRRVRTAEQIGGYNGFPDYYRELSHYDADSGALLSRLQIERDHPGRVHSIEIYVYRPDGRVARDYSATFLPGHRNAPVQTLVNLHGYQDGLASFRQFDASGSWIYEQCRGTWFDRDVEISNDMPAIGVSAVQQTSEEYMACFGMVPFAAGPYLDPARHVPGFVDDTEGGNVPPDASDAARARIAIHSGRLRLNPRDARALVKRGQAYFEALEFDKAIEDYTKAIALDPWLDEAYFGRGLALGRRGSIDEGIADLTLYLERNPQSSLGYTKRGVRYIWKGEFASAEQDLARAIELDPGNAEAHDDLGVVLARRGQHEAAIRHFETTIRLDPTYQKAYHNLALVRHLDGQNAEALAVLERGLRLHRASRSSLELKASVLMALGRRDEAAAAEQEALALPDANWSERLVVR